MLKTKAFHINILKNGFTKSVDLFSLLNFVI